MKRLLVVDDSPDAADVLSEYLRRKGYEVETAYGGLPGLVRYHQALNTITCQHCGIVTPPKPFDVLLLDIAMPDVDGWTIGRNVRNLEAFAPDLGRTRLIYVSAHPEIVSGTTLPKELQAAYFEKPIDYEKLIVEIERPPRRAEPDLKPDDLPPLSKPDPSEL